MERNDRRILWTISKKNLEKVEKELEHVEIRRRSI